jgi:hypothetical protein
MNTGFYWRIGGRAADRVLLADNNGFAAGAGLSFSALVRSDAIAIFRGKRTIFDLTHTLETASCRPCCLNDWQLRKLPCKEASITLSGRSAI